MSFFPAEVTQAFDDLYRAAIDVSLAVAHAEVDVIGKIKMCDTVGFVISKQLTMFQETCPETKDEACFRFGGISNLANTLGALCYGYINHPKLEGSLASRRIQEMDRSLETAAKEASKRFEVYDSDECQCVNCVSRRSIEKRLRQKVNSSKAPEPEKQKPEQSLAEMLGLPANIRIDTVEVVDKTGETPVLLKGDEAIAKMKSVMGL